MGESKIVGVPGCVRNYHDGKGTPVTEFSSYWRWKQRSSGKTILRCTQRATWGERSPRYGCEEMTMT